MFLLFSLLAYFATEPMVDHIFENLPEDSEDIFNLPYSVDFGNDGSLYMLDISTCRVHIWGPDRKYLKGFGDKGQGPGELQLPAKIVVTDSHIWIWGWDYRMSRFDLNGRFIDSNKTKDIMINFAVLSDNLLLVASKKTPEPRKTLAVFDLTNREGEVIKTLASFPNESYLTPRENTASGTVDTLSKAFPPELVIQKIADERWIYGFSQNSRMNIVNAKGEIVDSKLFKIPTQKPEDDDIKLVENLSYPTVGGRMVIKDLKSLKFDYNYNKAYYTHIQVSGDRIAFILTPLGGFGNYGSGYSRASYYVNDFKTGEVVGQGSYEYNEDSLVFYGNGRAVGFLLNDDSEYEIRELKLKGMP